MLNSSSELTEQDDEGYSVVGFIIVFCLLKSFSLHSLEEVLYYSQESCDGYRSLISRYGVQDRSGFFLSKKLLSAESPRSGSFGDSSF